MSDLDDDVPDRGDGQNLRGLPRVAGTKSLVGSFDAVDHGYEASGWIFDLARPMRHCLVQLRVDNEPIAQVEANIPRADLRAFRIRVDSGFRITIPASAFDGIIRAVELWAIPENARIGAPRPLACVISDHKTYPKTFSVNSILRLEDGAIDFDRVFSTAFLQRHGIRAAVAYAYLWILKRPPDRGGWDAYSDRILSGEIGIGTCLRELAGSEEAAKARRAGGRPPRRVRGDRRRRGAAAGGRDPPGLTRPHPPQTMKDPLR